MGCQTSGSNCVVVVEVTSATAELQSHNVVPFVAPYQMQLAKSTVLAIVGNRTAEDKVDIVLSASAPALYVVLTCTLEGRFSDNAFLLEATTPRSVSFIAWSKLDEDQMALLTSSLRVEHLADNLEDPRVTLVK